MTEARRRAEVRVAQRAAARCHHPDLGGRTEDLVAALAAIDRTSRPPRPVPVRRRRRAWWQRALGVLPRRRRYVEI